MSDNKVSKWLMVLAVLGVIFLLIVLGVAYRTEQQRQAPAQVSFPVLHPENDTIEGDEWIVKVLQYKVFYPDIGGNYYLLEVQLTVENKRDYDNKIFPSQFELQSAQGYLFNQTYFDKNFLPIVDGPVKPGEKLRGALYFKVLKASSGLTLLFTDCDIVYELPLQGD